MLAVGCVVLGGLADHYGAKAGDWLRRRLE